MPFVSHVAPAHHLATVRFTGTLDVTGIVAAMQALYEADAWAPGFSVLWDYRSVTEVILLPDDLKHVVDFGMANQARGGPGVDVNLINGRNDLHVLISRVFVVYRRHRPGTVRIPYEAVTVAEAAEVLKLPLPVVEHALTATS